MIKSWPINENSDSYDLMTYVWLEITNVRVEIDEALALHKILYKESDLQRKESLREDLIKTVDEITIIFDALDNMDLEINEKTKDSRIWRIYLHHKWIENRRLFDVKKKLIDLEDEGINIFTQIIHNIRGYINRYA